MTRLKSIPIFQAARTCGLTGFTLGGISSCVGLLLIFFISTESPIVTLTVLISLPFAGALAGFGGTAVVCWLYNLTAKWSGGLRFEMEEETVATRLGEEGEVVGPSPGYADAAGGRSPFPDERQQDQMDRGRQPALQPVGFYRLKLGAAVGEAAAHGAPSYRAPGDWVDVRNQTESNARTNGLCLYHLEYPSPGGEPEYRFVVTLPDCVLKPGEVLRLHSGPRRDLSALFSEDRSGADWHAFTGGEIRLWNRHRGDTAVLYAVATKETTDSVSYDPDPPEGIVLEREGARFVAARVGAAAHR
ncbi:MAG: hypothetical protein ACE141_05970 [Bryobacteraceae bacterium]